MFDILKKYTHKHFVRNFISSFFLLEPQFLRLSEFYPNIFLHFKSRSLQQQQKFT